MVLLPSENAIVHEPAPVAVIVVEAAFAGPVGLEAVAIPAHVAPVAV